MNVHALLNWILCTHEWPPPWGWAGETFQKYDYNAWYVLSFTQQHSCHSRPVRPEAHSNNLYYTEATSLLQWITIGGFWTTKLKNTVVHNMQLVKLPRGVQFVEMSSEVPSHEVNHYHKLQWRKIDRQYIHARRLQWPSLNLARGSTPRPPIYMTGVPIARWSLSWGQ